MGYPSEKVKAAPRRALYEIIRRKPLRSLVDKIVFKPTETQDRLTVDLYGDLPGILYMVTKSERPLVERDLSLLQPEKP